MNGDFWGEDEWDSRPRHSHRPIPHHSNSDRRSMHLSPGDLGAGLHRTRSVGHGPQPVINVYNDMYQEGAQARADAMPTAPYPPSPQFRGRTRLGEELLAQEVADLSLENARLRSRSRGRSDAGFLGNGYVDWRMQDQERIRNQLELERIRSEEAARIQQEKFQYERAKADEAARAKAAAEAEERKRWKADWEAQEEKRKREDQELRDRLAREAKAAAEKKKQEEQEWRDRIAREDKEKKEKEEKEYNDFLAKQKAKKEKEEADKKKAEADFEREMRRRLEEKGYSQHRIDELVKQDKDKKAVEETITTTSITRWGRDGRSPLRAPVYAKIHRRYLEIETLIYYDIPFEYDRSDPDYLIILREMDKHETNVLFEHTKSLRKRLLLEDKKEKPKYAWARSRSRSKVRGNGVVEIVRLK